ncbi:potassium channel protein [Panacagrimonas perspica]|uniref:potassium channel family protein n=1 Tax=Panacagrimonas perspica TaxID=381431 RepID=UPI00113F8829|nr:potassium channel family protein [Panacagrimonas perspica]THD03878.1 potassium channel protein [Panacagrimonas perspica]
MKTALPTIIRRRLFVQATRSPERVLLTRVLLLIVLVLAVLAIFWADRDGLKDHVDGHVSFGDVAYFTAVTITTVGYGDIVPVSQRARLVDTVLVTPLRLVIWLVFLGTAYELVLQRWMEARRMMRIQNTLSGHLVVCGFGHSGRSSAQEAVARGTPAAQIMVLDKDAKVLEQAAALGYIGLLGDATREQDLLDAGVPRAQAVLICLGRDDATVLTVLTVRQLAPSVRVICSVAEEENIKLVRQAGANAIVAPSIVGGYLMADSVRSSHVADYISDLMCSDGRVRLVERIALPEEVGKAIRDISPGLVVRILRGNSRIGFWEGPEAVVRTGDTLLEIEHS